MGIFSANVHNKERWGYSVKVIDRRRRKKRERLSEREDGKESKREEKENVQLLC